MILAEILKDSNYKLTQFSEDKIQTLEEAIIIKEIKGKTMQTIKQKMDEILKKEKEKCGKNLERILL